MKVFHYFGIAAILAAAGIIGCAGSGGDGSTGSTTGDPSDKSLTIRTMLPDDVVAVRDGDGSWLALTRGANGEFKTDLEDSSGRYSVAVLSPNHTSNNQPIDIYNLTTRDTRTLDLRVQVPAPGSKVLEGAVTGVPDDKLVFMGGYYWTPSNRIYSLQFTPPFDLAGAVMDGNALEGDLNPLPAMRFFLKRGITEGGTMDVAYPTEFGDVEEVTVQLQGLPAHPTGKIQLFFKPLNGTWVELPVQREADTLRFLSPPQALWRPGDRIHITAEDKATRRLTDIACFDAQSVGQVSFAPNLTVTVQPTETGRKMTFTTDPAYACYRIRAGNAAILQHFSRDYINTFGSGVCVFDPIPIPGFEERMQKSMLGDRTYLHAYATDKSAAWAMVNGAWGNNFEPDSGSGSVTYWQEIEARDEF